MDVVKVLDGAKLAMVDFFVVHYCKEETLVADNVFPDNTSKLLR